MLLLRRWRSTLGVISCCCLLLFLLYVPLTLQTTWRDDDYALRKSQVIDAPPPHTSNPNAPSHPYFAYLPFPRRPRMQPVVPSYKESFPPAFTGGDCASELPQWRTCDAPVCNATELPQVPDLLLPPHLSTAGVLSQRLLRRAWGQDPPMIDLYVRTGCGGALELAYMLQTLVVFYPRFLGDIILVLDVNDQPAVDFIVPKLLLAEYSVHVVYEHQPCMRARIFNQYSYMNLYKYSSAEFVMTIDSDCAFHRPVTPDVMFNSRGELVLATSKRFQSTFWNSAQMYFTRLDYAAFGHSMVTQPVSFRVETFPEFLAFARDRSVRPLLESTFAENMAMPTTPERQRRQLGQPQQPQQQFRCYEGLVADFLTAKLGTMKLFCWMCQLSTYVKHAQRPGYDVLVTDDDAQYPFMRYATHVTYDKARGGSSSLYYHQSVVNSTVQGVCYWLGGVGHFPECQQIEVATGAYEYLRAVTFGYAGFNLNKQFSDEQKRHAMALSRQRLWTLV